MYVTIPSNTNVKGNLCNKFKVIYPIPILSEGDKWEVSLSEFSYIHNLNILNPMKDGLVIKFAKNKQILPKSLSIFSLNISILGGYYNGIHEVINEINKKSSKFLQFSYNKKTGYVGVERKCFNLSFRFKNSNLAGLLGFQDKKTYKFKPVDLTKVTRFTFSQKSKYCSKTVKFKVYQERKKIDEKDIEFGNCTSLFDLLQLINVYLYPNVYIYLSNDLKIQINKKDNVKFRTNDETFNKMFYTDFKFNTTSLKPEIIFGEITADIFAGLHYMFLYCNICSYSYVGNGRSQVLKIIPIDLTNSQLGEVKNFKFFPEMFVPVLHDNLNQIEIELRSESGDLYPLTHGRSLCVLHFRQKS